MTVAVVTIPSVRSAIVDPDLQAYDVARVTNPMVIGSTRNANVEIAILSGSPVIVSKLVNQRGPAIT